MFGLGNMLGDLQNMKKEMETVKSKLDSIQVVASSEQNLVSIQVNGNKKVQSVTLHEDFSKLSLHQMQLHIKQALEKVMEQAEKVNEQEMKSVASTMIPGLGSMFSK